jgi:hypothetical protein
MHLAVHDYPLAPEAKIDEQCALISCGNAGEHFQPGGGAGFRANSGLKAQEYSATVLGLIFLCFRSFRERVSSMLELLNVLLQKEEDLRRTRDLLLPRLLSGQVNLKHN